ncbi:hypothetical protein TELCIR_06437 [Teladorsagia circumcincta]|uniref:Uncharacterized protein n=1 Tax=Teladorsagia circumcincta TaxID=45464 RepID=A0A2G9UN79_TELCI|nr:hypothetical protein TELCIR_06437 [Teladorsagia circumcincta]
MPENDKNMLIKEKIGKLITYAAFAFLARGVRCASIEVHRSTTKNKERLRSSRWITWDRLNPAHWLTSNTSTSTLYQATIKQKTLLRRCTLFHPIIDPCYLTMRLGLPDRFVMFNGMFTGIAVDSEEGWRDESCISAALKKE